MFGLFKKEVPKATSCLFRLTVHIGRGCDAEMPANLIGAHVPIFVGALDHEAAAMKAVSSLTSRGFEFIDISDRLIHELDPTKWDAFVKEAWPEFISYFPPQSKVLTTSTLNFSLPDHSPAMSQPTTPNPAPNLAPFGGWTLRDKAAQRW
jgi:hypothetical protein